MIVVRFKVQAQPDQRERVLAALRAVVGPSRELDGVVSFDIGADVSDPDSFVAIEVFADRQALQRQESLPEVTKALDVLGQSLTTEPEATIFNVSSSDPWGE